MYLAMYIVMKLFSWEIDFTHISSMYIYCLVAEIVGVLSYYFLEQPINRFVKKHFESNRQIYQRIDSHGIIVLERSGTFQHYSCLGGTCSDINRAEASGTAAGMGSRNSRLQE